MSVLSVLAAIQVRFDLTIAKRMRWRTIHKRAKESLHEILTERDRHRGHPDSSSASPVFLEGDDPCATVIVLVPSSQVSAEDKGQTVHHIHQAASVGWERKMMEELPAGTKFIHANRDGCGAVRGKAGTRVEQFG